MATDFSFIKGFRSQMAYFTESTYGTFAVTQSNAFRIGGKVRSVNWTARQNILQTGNIGDGRNYKQQLFGNYDASASVSWEVGDFSFLRYAVGDAAIWGDAGTSSASPYFLVSAEMSGVDYTAGSNTALAGSSSAGYSSVRVRPFSMLLYDIEDVSDGTTWNSTIDMLSGCMISDFSLSASVGTPLVCNTNVLVREIDYRRFLESSNTPNWGSSTAITDPGNGESGVITAGTSYNRSLDAPLMFYEGAVYMSGNKIGQVTSFNYGFNNQFITYRAVGDRFIEMPQLGMRRQTFSCNVVFRLPPQDSGIGQGIPTSSTTTILEIIKNYLGYASTATFTTATILKPALATNSASTSPQTSTAIEQTSITLTFLGPSTGLGNGHTRNAQISVYNAAVDGFGVPLVLENGLIEIPVNFMVRGYPYIKNAGNDGSYSGNDGLGITYANYNPTLSWWYT